MLDAYPDPSLRWPVRVRVIRGRKPHELLFGRTTDEYNYIGNHSGQHNGNYHGEVHRCMIEALSHLDVDMDLAGFGDEYHEGGITRKFDTIACRLSRGFSWCPEDLTRVGTEGVAPEALLLHHRPLRHSHGRLSRRLQAERGTPAPLYRLSAQEVRLRLLRALQRGREHRLGLAPRRRRGCAPERHAVGRADPRVLKINPTADPISNRIKPHEATSNLPLLCRACDTATRSSRKGAAGRRL